MAARTANSCAREVPRANSRMDTFAHASRSSNIVSYRPIVGHSFPPIGGQAFPPDRGPPVALAVLPNAEYCFVLWTLKDGGDLSGKESGRVGNSRADSTRAVGRARSPDRPGSAGEPEDGAQVSRLGAAARGL